MDYRIREIRENEYYILSDFLYEAIFIPEGMEKPPKSIIEQPELQVYITDFGKADDWCLVAEVKEKIVGAVWVRIMNDYGHIDDKTPYWRTLKANGELNAKYPGGIEVQKEFLEKEGHTVITKGRKNIRFGKKVHV